MSDAASLPPFASWPSFPFAGDLHVKSLEEPVAVEPVRHGENPAECRACNAPDEDYIWVSERWRVRSSERPTGLPVVLVLEPRSHLDLGDLSNMLAAELGVMTVRVERAIRSLDDVARVHVSRWGDGAFHLHVWFLARPSGRLQLRGTFLSLWNDILPPITEERWRENLALVAAWLEEFGGRALAEPPRIHWTAPSHFAPDTEAAALASEDGDESDTKRLPQRSAEPGSAEPETPARRSTADDQDHPAESPQHQAGAATGTPSATADTPDPGGQTPDTMTPDTMTPDGVTPDTMTPDGVTPDGTASNR